MWGHLCQVDDQAQQRLQGLTELYNVADDAKTQHMLLRLAIAYATKANLANLLGPVIKVNSKLLFLPWGPSLPPPPPGPRFILFLPPWILHNRALCSLLLPLQSQSPLSWSPVQPWRHIALPPKLRTAVKFPSPEGQHQLRLLA